jgi:hypothetical protein
MGVIQSMQEELQSKQGEHQPKQGEKAYDMTKKVFIAEGNFSKAYIVTRLHDKLECVAKLLKPTIAGIDDDSKA